MKVTDLLANGRMGLLALATVSLIAGCGGGDTGPAGPAGPAGSTGQTGPQGPAGQGLTLNASQFTAAQAQSTVLKGTVTGVTIGNPAVVSFTVTDGSGNPITGLTTSQLGFTVAKLVPGTTTTITSGSTSTAITSASKWVSYFVEAGVPAVDTSTGNSYSGQVVVQPARPGTDTKVATNLVDHGDGTYTYTFARNFNGTSTSACDATSATTAAACPVQAALNNWFGTLTTRNAATGSDVYLKSQILGADGTLLDYNPNLTHRIAIQISGTVNTYALNNPINIIYDWVPATGVQITAANATAANERNIVDVQACNSCHGKAGVPLNGLGTTTPHTGRVDPAYCVMCHTDQRKNGRANLTAVPATGSVYQVGGLSWGNLPTLVHKIHMGKDLTIPNSNFAGVAFNKITYPQDQRNCTKCHNGSTSTDPQAAAVTPNGDNWKNVPSIEACGACHDQVPSLTDATVTSAAHSGGAGYDDTKCALCHNPTVIAGYHAPVTPPDPTNAWVAGGTVGNTHTSTAWLASNQNNLPAGAIAITYSVSSVGTVTDATNNVLHPTIKFCLQQPNAQGVPTCTNFNAAPTSGSIKAASLWNNFIGGPSLQFAWAEPEDGNTNPVDWNVNKAVVLKKLWFNQNGTYDASGNSTAKGVDTLSGPDSNGMYTATLNSISISTAGKLLYGGVGFGYGTAFPLTQTNLSAYPITAVVNPQSGDSDGYTGGLVVVAPVVFVPATGNDGSGTKWAARRTIVSNAACNSCHQRLGPFTSSQFHAGQRNDGTVCGACHFSNYTSNGTSLDSTLFVHNIHNASLRSYPWTYANVSASAITYPNELFQCNACHVNNAVGNYAAGRLFKTFAAGSVTAGGGSNVGSYGTGYSVSSSATAVTVTPAAGTTLVVSPTAAACSACHDNATSVYHMQANGAMIDNSVNSPLGDVTGVARSTVPVSSTGALVNQEQCSICHATGAIADAQAVHDSRW